jgi:hypothetical protein
MAKKTEKKTEKKEVTRRERFIRNAERRTRKAIVAINSIAGCANSTTNEWNEDEVEKIFAALEEACASAKAAFAPGAEPKENVFSFLD